MGLKIAKPVLAVDPSYSESFGTAKPAASPQPSPEAPAPSAGSREPSPEAPSVRPTPPAAPAPAPAATSATPRGQGGVRARPGRRGGERREPPVMVNVKVRPLDGQARRIEAAGLPMQPILRAAWGQATAGLVLGPSYTEPPEGQRAEEAHAIYRTTIRVDAAVLAELARVHDPYGVTGRWALIRGQIEERFWQAVDAMLDRFAPAQEGTGANGDGRG